MASLIDSEAKVGTVALSVADLERSLSYYQQSIGLAVLNRSGASAALGVGTTPLLCLHEAPGARVVRRATGLYHFALRVPSRRDLARVIRHFAESGTRIGGASDHLFSEALYLSDPDGHGIEIYRDRPRDTWYDSRGKQVADIAAAEHFYAEVLVLQRDFIRNCQAAAAGACGVRSRLDSFGLGCTG